MILETFMPEYTTELYGKNGSSKLDCALLAEAKNIEKAAVEAAQELEKVEFIVGYKEVWNAEIVNPKGENYKILKDGEWLIDTKTGKKLDSLEGKLD